MAKLPYTNLSIRPEAAKKLIAFAKRDGMSTMEFFDELAKRIPDQVDAATLFAVLENSVLLKMEKVSISVRAQANLAELFYKLQRIAGILHSLIVLAETGRYTPYQKGSLQISVFPNEDKRKSSDESHKRMDYWLLLKPLEPKITNALSVVGTILNRTYPGWSTNFADTSGPFIANLYAGDVAYTIEEACRVELRPVVDEALEKCDQIGNLREVVPETCKTLEETVRPALDEVKSVLEKITTMTESSSG